MTVRDREVVCEKPVATVTSLSLAGYLMMRGAQLANGKRSLKDSREFEFVFEDPRGEIEKWSLDFLQSDCRKFDDCVRHLRSIVNTKKSTTR